MHVQYYLTNRPIKLRAKLTKINSRVSKLLPYIGIYELKKIRLRINKNVHIQIQFQLTSHLVVYIGLHSVDLHSLIHHEFLALLDDLDASQ